MPWLRHPGCANFFVSSTPHPARLPWFIATTSAPSTCHPTRFSTNALNTLRLIFILFESVSHLVLSAFFTCRRRPSMPTSSPRVCRQQSFRNSGPV
uniref:Uncharacterized protein n=1 Tax=Arundo donax TaxID=35708 RepID=A0A0A9FEV9_ARUDO